MAIQVNIHDAKTNLSKLLQSVEQGEEIVIARGGRPVARIVAYKKPVALKWLGKAAGKIEIADDFDAPLPEFEADFYK